MPTDPLQPQILATANLAALLFPRHKCSLHLTHNQHTAYHQTVAQYIQDREDRGQEVEWVSETQMRKALDTNEIWELQWYPETPLGSHSLLACDLNELLIAAKEY